jgi:uncharacterized damage-inducible protein DinB
MAMMVEPILREFKAETPATRRILERVSTDKLTWKPHEKSRTLGQLALHVANLPGMAAKITDADEFSPNIGAPPTQVNSADDIRAAFEKNAAIFEERVATLTDEAAQGSWRLVVGGKERFRTTKLGALRSNVLNHLYHHRGQLSVYLRLLDIPVPSVYGPTADENPFTK